LPPAPTLNLVTPQPDRAPPSAVPAPSTDAPPCPKHLQFVLSVIAGSTDVIGFLGLGGLFTAHITGNLVMLAAHIAGGTEAQFSEMLSVPVFIVVVTLTTLLGDGLEAIGLSSLRPLLLLQFLLLAGFLVLCVAAGAQLDPNSENAVVAGMVGVSAMAVQNALVQTSFKGTPSTAVMTSNITHFAIDIGKVLRGGDPADVAKARSQAARILAVIVGFAAGCSIGAACEVVLGLWSLAVPAGLALLALAIGFAVNPDGGGGP
jgi:uncharacterized membrane protein YoaK (UPF0700 family)